MKYFNSNNEIEKTNDYNLIYIANSSSSKMQKKNCGEGGRPNMKKKKSKGVHTTATATATESRAIEKIRTLI